MDLRSTDGGRELTHKQTQVLILRVQVYLCSHALQVKKENTNADFYKAFIDKEEIISNHAKRRPHCEGAFSVGFWYQNPMLTTSVAINRF